MTYNNAGVGTSNITIVVNAEVPPTVSAGGPVTVILPTSTTTLNGSVTANGGASITSIGWTQVTGPNTATIVSPTNQVTVINGLIVGSYIFNLSATDNNGNSGSSTATVTVTPTGSGINYRYAVFPGEYQCGLIDYNTGFAYGLSTNLNNTGSGGAGAAAIPVRFLTTPANLKFKTGAGGLHGICMVDTAGYPWVAGDNTSGLGNGSTIGNILTPFRITGDSAGNNMGNVAQVVSYFAGNTSPGYYFLMNDGTLKIVGDTRCGMRGDGTIGLIDSFVVNAAPLPGGRRIVQIVAGYHAIALANDSTVWTTGGGTTTGPLTYAALGYTPTNSATDYRSWHQVTLPAKCVQVAGGIYWDYAVLANGKLYGWGFYGTYLGKTGTAGGTPIPLPIELTELEAVLIKPVAKISTNSMCSYAILSDSTLWGWGDNAMGNIGNGVEINYATYATPYAYDLGTPGGLLQTLPVQISNLHTFIGLFNSSVFTFYTYAEVVGNQLYSWGRNKGGILGNGIKDPSGGDISAAYPNSWDVPWFTPVNPFTLTVAYVTTCPYCLLNPTLSPCNKYPIPANTAPVSNPGNSQTITANSVTLNGSGSTDNVHITYYKWALVSGPNTPTFDIVSGPTVNVSNLINGTYIISLTVTDNGWLSNNNTVTTTVGTKKEYFIIKKYSRKKIF